MNKVSSTYQFIGQFLPHTFLQTRLKLLAILSLTLATGVTLAADFSGQWSYATSGSFDLELVERGTMVCGQITAISGQKVDFTGVVGNQTSKGLVVHFTSGFADKGSHGIATLQRLGHKLEWNVSQAPNGESWIWESVELSLRRWQPGREKVVSDWCKPQWKKIQEGQLERIQLLDPW